MRTVRVLWPLDVIALERAEDYQPSLVIGWNNADSDLVVVTTLPYLDPSVVATLLQRDTLLKGSKYPSPHIYDRCGLRRMSILGTLNVDHSILANSVAELKGNPRRFMINARLDDSMKYPQQITDSASQEHPVIQTILFSPPDSHRMQYLSIYPISLALSEKRLLTLISEEYEKTLVERSQGNQQLMDKIELHSLRDMSSADKRKQILKNCIAQVNCCVELGLIMRRNAAIEFPRLKARRRRLSMSESVLESARTVHNGVWSAAATAWDSAVPALSWLLVTVLIFLRVVAEGILRVIEWKSESFPYALKDISATAQQIDLRLEQFCFWPVQYLTIRKRSKDWDSNNDFNVEYVRFYNTIWLVVNDVILGVAIGGVIIEKSDIIAIFLCYLIDDILAVRFRENMVWLMDWPAGLKLNNQLAAFFGELFLFVVMFWASVLSALSPYYGTIIRTIGFSGVLGLTLSISMVSDLVSFTTLHVYAFYVASARIYHLQLVILNSLFLLFRGKKHNVLRNRIDSCNYELDQLLMGTILFTVLLFLLPTVLVFYLFFAFNRLVIVMSCACLESVLSCLNHFPLFVILLRFKDPLRIPGGIRFERIGKDDAMILRPIPLGFQHIFHQYNILGERMRMHYLSFQVVRHILSGQFVPIPRSKLYVLLYSMLPEKRVGIQSLIQALRAKNA